MLMEKATTKLEPPKNVVIRKLTGENKLPLSQ